MWERAPQEMIADSLLARCQVPTYNYVCAVCGYNGDRYQVPVAEQHSQICACGQPLQFNFVPTKSRPVVYGNDSKYPAAFTGPKQAERYMKEHNLAPLGNESPDTVQREFKRMADDAEEARDKAIGDAVDEVFAEHGDRIFTEGPEPETVDEPETVLADRHPDTFDGAIGEDEV